MNDDQRTPSYPSIRVGLVVGRLLSAACSVAAVVRTAVGGSPGQAMPAKARRVSGAGNDARETWPNTTDISRRAWRMGYRPGLFLILIVVLAACAKSSDEISAAYVSPLAYEDYTCRQLRAELGRLNRRVIEKTGAQDKAADSDVATMGVALILFWPALFFIDGDDQNTVEFARLKGEFEAAEKAAIKKDCDVSNEIAEARAAQDAYQAERQNRGQDADPMTQ